MGGFSHGTKWDPLLRDLNPKNWTTCVRVWLSYQEVDMSFQHELAFRRDVCERLLAGEPAGRSSPKEVSSMSESTLFRWKRQALIDVGRVLGP